MKENRSSRRLIRSWHRREKAVIDQVVSNISDGKDSTGTVHPAVTATGLSVADQLRKAWQPTSVGLAMF